MIFLRRWALNRGDLVIAVVALVVITVLAALGILSQGAQSWAFGSATPDAKLTGAIFAGWVAIVLAGIGGAVRITSTRQGLTSLFSSEIRALQFGLSTMEMFGFWAVAYAKPEVGAMGFADVPRDEKYFETFHSVADNIGNLQPKVVEAIVRFYTYLKMSRDAAASLYSWEKQTDPLIRQLHVTYVVRLLSISMLWGFVALWSMGFRARQQEIEFLKKIEQGYDAVVGSRRFADMVGQHPEATQLRSFFGAALGRRES